MKYLKKLHKLSDVAFEQHTKTVKQRHFSKYSESPFIKLSSKRLNIQFSSLGSDSLIALAGSDLLIAGSGSLIAGPD